MRYLATIMVIIVSLSYTTSSKAKANHFFCQIQTEVDKGVNVTTEEERGQVTYEVIANGNVFSYPAIFTADKVIWGPPGDNITRMQYTISRVDLSFSFDYLIGGKVITPRTGVCRAIDAPKRAF